MSYSTSLLPSWVPVDHRFFASPFAFGLSAIDPTSSFFSKYDITDAAGIPPTKTPVSVLYGIYPDVQFLSSNASNGHTVGSYFNRMFGCDCRRSSLVLTLPACHMPLCVRVEPTPTGWAVYDLSALNGIASTKTAITVVSQYQFIVIGTDSHVYNNYYANGYWNIQDLTANYKVPSTNMPITLFKYGPLLSSSARFHTHTALDLPLLHFHQSSISPLQFAVVGTDFTVTMVRTTTHSRSSHR